MGSWVIVGGESGPRAGAMDLGARSVRDQRVDPGVRFKQWGGLRPKDGGRELMGASGTASRPNSVGRRKNGEPRNVA